MSRGSLPGSARLSSTGQRRHTIVLETGTSLEKCGPISEQTTEPHSIHPAKTKAHALAFTTSNSKCQSGVEMRHAGEGMASEDSNTAHAANVANAACENNQARYSVLSNSWWLRNFAQEGWVLQPDPAEEMTAYPHNNTPRAPKTASASKPPTHPSSSLHAKSAHVAGANGRPKRAGAGPQQQQHALHTADQAHTNSVKGTLPKAGKADGATARARSNTAGVAVRLCTGLPDAAAPPSLKLLNGPTHSKHPNRDAFGASQQLKSQQHLGQLVNKSHGEVNSGQLHYNDLSRQPDKCADTLPVTSQPRFTGNIRMGVAMEVEYEMEGHDHPNALSVKYTTAGPAASGGLGQPTQEQLHVASLSPSISLTSQGRQSQPASPCGNHGGQQRSSDLQGTRSTSHTSLNHARQYSPPAPLAHKNSNGQSSQHSPARARTSSNNNLRKSPSVEVTNLGAQAQQARTPAAAATGAADFPDDPTADGNAMVGAARSQVPIVGQKRDAAALGAPESPGAGSMQLNGCDSSSGGAAGGVTDVAGPGMSNGLNNMMPADCQEDIDTKDVIVAKSLTRTDASTRRIILPRIAIEANLPEAVTSPGGSFMLPTWDEKGRFWDFVLQAWSNGHNPKPVYVLEHISEYMKEYNISEGDVMGICR